ncbi:MAG: tyrosine-type recombinase/integrase [Anaerolineae bacterium]|nr:tyrosine-type recombinase/integrase [Anaerolineae bacterium]
MGIINGNGLLDKFEAHLLAAALAPATVANYMADLRAFLRWSEETLGGEHSPLDLEARDIEAFCSYLQRTKGNAPTTVNRRIQALRKFYAVAIDAGWTECNPAEPVSLRKERASKRSRSLTAKDVDRLLDAVKSGHPRRMARDWAVIQLLLNAGLKLGELTELEMDDLCLDGEREPYLCVHDRDGGEAREIPLDSEVCEALDAYLQRRQAAPGVTHLCVNRDGQPLSRRSIQRLLRRYARAAGLDGLTTQALRFVYAKRVYDQSGDIKIVARHLGHRHLATTIRYLRSSSGSKK